MGLTLFSFITAGAAANTCETDLEGANIMPPRKRARGGAAPAQSAPAQSDSIALVGDDLSEVGRSLATFQRAGKLCDISVIVGNRTFTAHQVVLAATCPYFEALIVDDRFSEASAGEVRLQEMSEEVFACILEFLYTRKCALPLALLQPVLEAACRLRVESLQAAAEVAIIERLTPSSCLDAWNVADHLSLTALAAAAKKVALDSFEEVASEGGASFAQLRAEQLGELLAHDDLNVEKEEEVYKVLERWVAAQASPPAHEVVEALLSHVRFPVFTSKEAQREVEAAALLQPHLIVLATAYREASNQEGTPRTRLRTVNTPSRVATVREHKGYSEASAAVIVTAVKEVIISSLQGMAGYSPSSQFTLLHKQGKHDIPSISAIPSWTTLIAPTAGQDTGSSVNFPTFQVHLRPGEEHTFVVMSTGYVETTLGRSRVSHAPMRMADCLFDDAIRLSAPRTDTTNAMILSCELEYEVRHS